MSTKKKNSTQASYIKALTDAELIERQSRRLDALFSRGTVGFSMGMESVGALDRLKTQAAEADQSIAEFFANEQAVLREQAINLPESEYCLEPDEISLFHESAEKLPTERRQHLDSCGLCQSVVKAAVHADCDAVGHMLAEATLQEAVSAAAN